MKIRRSIRKTVTNGRWRPAHRRVRRRSHGDVDGVLHRHRPRRHHELGRRRPVRIGRQLGRQHRQRQLRRTAVQAGHLVLQRRRRLARDRIARGADPGRRERLGQPRRRLAHLRCQGGTPALWSLAHRHPSRRPRRLPGHADQGTVRHHQPATDVPALLNPLESGRLSADPSAGREEGRGGGSWGGWLAASTIRGAGWRRSPVRRPADATGTDARCRVSSASGTSADARISRRTRRTRAAALTTSPISRGLPDQRAYPWHAQCGEPRERGG